MRLFIVALLLAVSLTGSASALDIGPNFKITDTARTLITNNEAYPLRLENVLFVKAGELWVLDLFQWDRAGLVTKVVKTNPTVVKDITRNQVNNKLAVGYDVWKGFGPVYELQNQWTKLPVNRFGVGHRASFTKLGFTVLSAAEALVATTGDAYNFRVSEFALIRHSSGLWAQELFTGDFGNGHRLNNKIVAGLDFTEHLAVALERQDTTGNAIFYGIGLQGRF